MEENILIDLINIKTLPELIVNYLRENNVESNLNSVRIIYSILLENISIEIKDSYLNKIQKYLSSSEQTNILIFDDINNNIYDNELMTTCNLIVKDINNKSFYQDLLNKCYFIHFDELELKNINHSFEKNDYNKFIFYLFKHAIKNYKVSTPKILAERLFNDACTLARKAPLKKNLYKIAADLGHQLSAIEYASIIEKENFHEALIYYLKAKDLNASLWKIGYDIEHFKLNQDDFEWVKKELKDIITYSSSYDETKVIALKGKNNFEKECVVIAYKIFFYLANEKNFSKGYNSLGKFLINSKVKYIDKKDNKEMGIYYLKKAISLSNIHAMQNLALYYRQNGINLDKVKPLLFIGAECEDLISCVGLSEILMEENKYDEAINYLKYASCQNSSYAQYNLGKMYENKFDYDNAKECYKSAIINGMESAAIDLSLIYFKEYVDNKDENIKTSYLLNAINILSNHYSLLNDSDKEKANKLLEKWNEILN